MLVPSVSKHVGRWSQTERPLNGRKIIALIPVIHNDPVESIPLLAATTNSITVKVYRVHCGFTVKKHEYTDFGSMAIASSKKN